MELYLNLTVPLNMSNNPEGALQDAGNKTSTAPLWYESGRIQIPLYAIIFMLAVIGNTLVILTLVSALIFLLCMQKIFEHLNCERD